MILFLYRNPINDSKKRVCEVENSETVYVSPRTHWLTTYDRFFTKEKTSPSHHIFLQIKFHRDHTKPQKKAHSFLFFFPYKSLFHFASSTLSSLKVTIVSINLEKKR